MSYNEVGGIFKNIILILLMTIWVSNYITIGILVICIIIVDDPLPPLIFGTHLKLLYCAYNTLYRNSGQLSTINTNYDDVGVVII